MALAYVQLILN
jgi:hypothetical protein